MLVAIFCEKMHWTYEEFLEQPHWFIETLLIKWSEETKANKKQQKE